MNTNELFNEIETSELALPKRSSAGYAKKAVETTEAPAPSAPITEAQRMGQLDVRQKGLVPYYKAEKRIPVRIAPSYANHFGKVMRIGINGIIVAVRCDGSVQHLPASFAAVAFERMAHVDGAANRRHRMADVTGNFERQPRQLDFFS